MASVVDGTDDKLVDVVGVGIDMCGVGGCIDSWPSIGLQLYHAPTIIPTNTTTIITIATIATIIITIIVVCLIYECMVMQSKYECGISMHCIISINMVVWY